MNQETVDIDSLVRKACGFEPLSVRGLHLSKVMRQSSWTSVEVAEIVDGDVELRERVLDWANRSCSGSQRQFHSVEGALIRVGPGLALGLAAGLSVRNWMQQALPEYGLSEGVLWKHSVAAAMAVDLAHNFCRIPIAPEAFCTALLHDVGKLVLASHLHDRSAGSQEGADESHGLNGEEAEVETFKTCHTELGARLSAHWQLSPATADGIRFHHSPILGPTAHARRLGNLVALGDVVATAIGVGCETDPSRVKLTPAIAGALGISLEGFDSLCREVQRGLEDGLELLAA